MKKLFPIISFLIGSSLLFGCNGTQETSLPHYHLTLKTSLNMVLNEKIEFAYGVYTGNSVYHEQTYQLFYINDPSVVEYSVLNNKAYLTAIGLGSCEIQILFFVSRELNNVNSHVDHEVVLTVNVSNQ